ncbi:MAG: hypothetical protein ABEJ78_07900 [Haloferacaceae archaeon]
MVARRTWLALGALVGLPVASRGASAWRVRRLRRSLDPADSPSDGSTA